MKLVPFILMVLGACRGDVPTIVVADDGSTPQIVFVNCKTPDRLLPVQSVEVVRTDAASPSYTCKLSRRESATLVGAWRYGTPAAGYDVTGCPPLTPGEYEVKAVLHFNAVTTKFQVAADGRIKMTSGGCGND